MLAATFLGGTVLYFPGLLKDMRGYYVADAFLGPLWAPGLIAVVFVLREQIGERAPRRMTLALIGAALAGLMMVTAAVIRSTNRGYLDLHPELDARMTQAAYLAWITIVHTAIAVGQHFLGWTLLLTASAGWTSRQLPRLLCGVLALAGVLALTAYLDTNWNAEFGRPDLALLGLIWGIWQGIIFLRAKPPEMPAPKEEPQPA
jgi:hypothetical protein